MGKQHRTSIEQEQHRMVRSKTNGREQKEIEGVDKKNTVKIEAMRRPAVTTSEFSKKNVLQQNSSRKKQR